MTWNLFLTFRFSCCPSLGTHHWRTCYYLMNLQLRYRPEMQAGLEFARFVCGEGRSRQGNLLPLGGSFVLDVGFEPGQAGGHSREPVTTLVFFVAGMTTDPFKM